MKPDLVYSIACLVMLLSFLYWILAASVFSWRNPKANGMSVYRELPAVLKFEKLERYQ